MDNDLLPVHLVCQYEPPYGQVDNKVYYWIWWQPERHPVPFTH